MRLLLITVCMSLASIGIAAQGATGKPVDVVILETKLQAVLGGVREGKLIDAKTAAPSLGDEELFKHFRFSAASGSEFRVPPGEEPSVPCEEFFGYKSTDEPLLGVAFGSNVTWNPVPRKISEISPNSRVYRNLIRRYLKRKGIGNPAVKIREAYRVDLEGDGTDEVIIRAEHYSNFGPAAKKGEYSFVLLRKIFGKSVRNILITGEFYTKSIEFGAPNRLEISGIVDLDGDGTSEIVIYGQYYEGIWAEAYGLVGDKPKVVLQTGCGV